MFTGTLTLFDYFLCIYLKPKQLLNQNRWIAKEHLRCKKKNKDSIYIFCLWWCINSSHAFLWRGLCGRIEIAKTEKRDYATSIDKMRMQRLAKRCVALELDFHFPVFMGCQTQNHILTKRINKKTNRVKACTTRNVAFTCANLPRVMWP